LNPRRAYLANLSSAKGLWRSKCHSSQVQHLISLGPLPSEQVATVEQLRQFEAALVAVVPPLSDEEAVALLTLFGSDGCFGLAWTLVHLVESAPGWPLADCVTNPTSLEIALLKERAERGAFLHGGRPGSAS
jgi:hypothetical protein